MRIFFYGILNYIHLFYALQYLLLITFPVGTLIIMQQYEAPYNNCKIQRTKFVDTFQQNIRQIAIHIGDLSAMNLKLYQIINQSYAQQQNGITFVLSLIKMFLLKQALKQSNVSLQSKCQSSLDKITKQVELNIFKYQKIGNMGLQLFLSLCKQPEQEKYNKNFDLFLVQQTPLLYNKFQIIWKLIIFKKYVQQLNQQGYQKASQLSKLQEGFRVYLQKQQQQFLLGLNIRSIANQEIGVKQVRKSNIEQARHVLIVRPKEERGILLSHQAPKYRNNITIKEIMLVQINLQIIGLVEGCQAYKRPYLIFLIPFAYVLAQCLTHYKNHQNLYIYHVFIDVCKRINKIKSGSNTQLVSAEVDQFLLDLLNFKKGKDKQLCGKLSAFLIKYRERMLSFIPYYYEILSFHAFQKYQFVQILFSQRLSINERRKKIKLRIRQLYQSCSRYHNQHL